MENNLLFLYDIQDNKSIETIDTKVIPMLIDIKEPITKREF